MLDGDKQLPVGWAHALIDELVSSEGIFKDGDWVESKDQTPDGNVRLIQLADIGDGYFVDKSARFLTKEKARELKCTFLKEGDLLVARMPDPLGRCCIFPLRNSESFVTVVDICVIRPETLEANSKFLMYLINSPLSRSAIESFKTGSTRKRISRKNLAKICLPIPPLNEQRRIVAKIEELFSEIDKGIESLQTAKAQLQIYRQSLLKHAFEGKLTAQWRKDNPDKIVPAEQLLAQIKQAREERYQQQLDDWKAAVEQWEQGGKQGKKPSKLRKIPELEVLSQSELDDLAILPDTWMWVKVKQLGEVKLGRQRAPQHHQGEHMRPYLRVANVFESRIDTSDVLEMNFTPEEYEVYKLQNGDILLNEGQSLEWVGRSAIFRDEVPGACFQNTLVRFRPESQIDPEFLQALFVMYLYTGRFQKIAKWTTNIAHLGASRFAEVEAPLPPLAEQKIILEEWSKVQSNIDYLSEVLSEQLVRAEAIKQSILKQAFSGQLVPQDPNDEPASELLARIKTEKAERRAQAKATKAKKPRKPRAKTKAKAKPQTTQQQLTLLDTDA